MNYTYLTIDLFNFLVYGVIGVVIVLNAFLAIILGINTLIRNKRIDP